MRQLRIDMSKCDAGRSCQHECEEACAIKVFKLDSPEHAALHIRELPDGSGQALLCDQCGDCVVVCPADALRRNKMRAALTALGVIIGVGAVIAMSEIGEGSKAALQKTIALMEKIDNAVPKWPVE